MNSTLFWIIIIILVIVVVLIIWLLARGSQSQCKEGQKLNQSCTQTSDCNAGLVCDQLLGGRVCKVASGGVCATNEDCGSNLSCQNGVCMGKGNGLNGPCPCGEGLTCVNNVCKIKIGSPCTSNGDCADGICRNNVCATNNPNAFVPTEQALTNLLNAMNDGYCGECGNKRDDCGCHEKYDNYSSDLDKYYYSDSNCSESHRKKKYSDSDSYSSESDNSYKHKNRKFCSNTDCSYYSIIDSNKSKSYDNICSNNKTDSDKISKSTSSLSNNSSKFTTYTMTSSNNSN